MTAKQKYDDIINFIEEQIAQGLNLKASTIINEIKNNFYIDERALGQIFSFLTNMPINTYIKRRQLIKAAEVLLDNENIEDAIQYTGFSDEPSFSKAFKKEFALPPGKFKESNSTTVEPALNWDVIANFECTLIKEKKSLEETKFGIPIDTYNKVIEAENMQIIYGFDDTVSEVAYKLSKVYECEMRDAFELVDELIIHFEENKFYIECFDDFVKMYDEIIWTFFNFDLSFCQSIELVGDLKTSGVKDIKKEDPYVIAYYYETGYNYDFVKECWEFYTTKNNCGVEFKWFIDSVCEYGSFETACEVWDCSDVDMSFTLEDMQMDENELAMEKWANEETDYSNYEGLDDFYDPDNPED